MGGSDMGDSEMTLATVSGSSGGGSGATTHTGEYAGGVSGKATSSSRRLDIWPDSGLGTYDHEYWCVVYTLRVYNGHSLPLEVKPLQK